MQFSHDKKIGSSNIQRQKSLLGFKGLGQEMKSRKMLTTKKKKKKKEKRKAVTIGK